MVVVDKGIIKVDGFPVGTVEEYKYPIVEGQEGGGVMPEISWSDIIDAIEDHQQTESADCQIVCSQTMGAKA